MEGERDDRGHDLRGDLGEFRFQDLREARAVSALVCRPTARRDDLGAVFADDLVVLRRASTSPDLLATTIGSCSRSL